VNWCMVIPIMALPSNVAFNILKKTTGRVSVQMIVDGQYRPAPVEGKRAQFRCSHRKKNLPKKSLMMEILILLLLAVSPTLSAPVGDSEAIGVVKKSDDVQTHSDEDEDRKPRWTFNYAPGQNLININTVSGGDFKIGHNSEIQVNIEESSSQLSSPGPTVDGVLSEWSSFGRCTATCGGGIQTRERTCTPQTNGGKPCYGPTEDQQACNLQDCPEEVALYDVCTPGPYILINADCFCGDKNGKGKLCNKGFKCINSDKDEGLKCIDPDEDNFPCGFNDELLEKKESNSEDGQLSVFDTSELFKWTENKVPYYYSDENVRNGDKVLIETAMKKIEDKTCFKFINGRKDDLENEHSLEIVIEDVTCTRSSGSVSDVKQSQRLQLKFYSHLADKYGNDCGNIGLVNHELMHALGVGHTQRRSDRDDIIKVEFTNFGRGTSEVTLNQYRKCGSECEVFESIPYDCGSIMHYGTHYAGKQVIVPIDEETCKLYKQPRLYFDPDPTAKDYELLSIIGKCAGECEYDKDKSDKDIPYCGSEKYMEGILEFMEKRKLGCVKEGNTDYFGNDIPGKNKIVSGVEECMNWCGETSECGYWTYGKSDRHCYLKTSDSGRYENTDRISGTKKCLPGCLKEDNIDYNGNDIPGKSKIVSGVEECINWCGETAACGYWTYRKSDRHCWLKTSDSGRSENTDRISGTKKCSTE